MWLCKEHLGGVGDIYGGCALKLNTEQCTFNLVCNIYSRNVLKEMGRHCTEVEVAQGLESQSSY